MKKFPIIQEMDENMADYDSKKGYNLWGSAGMCYGCEHKDECESVPSKQNLHGIWARCPRDDFKIDPVAAPMVWNWKDSLIDYAQSRVNDWR